MATITLTADKDASAWYNSDAWSGFDNHLPVGTNSNGNKWASFVHFNINFSGWTSVTSATLKLYGAQVDYVTHNNGNTATTLYIQRMTSDWGVGTNRGENLWSSSETWGWTNRVDAGNTTTGRYAPGTGPQSSSWNNVQKSYDVTGIVQTWFSGTANYGFLLKNANTSSAYGLDFYSRRTSGKEPQLTITYETNNAPTAPNLDAPVGGSTTIVSVTPTLTFTRNDVDAGDYISAYTAAVYADAGGSALVWSSGDIATGGSPVQVSVPVAITLNGNTQYWWKARTRDRASAWSGYSGLGSFKTNTPPPVPSGFSPASGSTITTLTPTFTGVSVDPDPGDSLAYAQVMVYTDAGGSNQIMPASGNGVDVAASGSTFSIPYNGTALSAGTTYYWRACVRDQNGQYSNWSALQSFTTYTVGTPTGLSPSGAKVNTLTPTLSGTASVTMNAYKYVIYQSDGITPVYTSGDVGASGTAVSFAYGGAPALSWGTKYYWKLATRDTSNVYSPFTNLQAFWTNASPNATLVSPSSGAVVADTTVPAFTAQYSDADQANGFSDNPTKFQVEVSRVSDSVVMYTLYRTTSIGTSYNTMKAGDAGVTQTAGAGGTTLTMNTLYRWRAQYTDSSGAANNLGPYSGYLTFKPTDSPWVSSFVVQAADLTTGAVNKPTPTLTYTFHGSGGKAQASRRLVVIDTSNSQTVYDSGTYSTSSTSVTVPAGVLDNTLTFQYNLTVTDTDGLSGTATVSYLTTWIPPSALTGFTITADDLNSRIIIAWDATTLSTSDFNKYTLYRKRLDSGESSYTTLASITDKGIVIYYDYDAGVGAQYEYYVTQWKTIAGDSPIESPKSDVVQTILIADKWFLTVPGRSDMTIPLDVTDETHTAPFAEETFEPFGRSRKIVVRSGRYGNEGSIETFFDASVRATYEKTLDNILNLRTAAYLKSPFGDIFRITLYAPQKKYLTGGHLQVTLSYVEVD